MGRLFLIDLVGAIYRCKFCDSHLGIADDILSKAFHSRNGKAYLFDRIVNVTLGEREDRMMITGLHTVFHILGQPSPKLNLLQEVAFEDDQKYKEGKFILERFQVIGPYGNDVQLAQEPQFLPDLEDIEDA